MKVIATVDTFLKALPVQSGKLKNAAIPEQIVSLPEGTELEIVDHYMYEGSLDTENDDHYFLQLAQPYGDNQAIRWFVYALHVKIEGVEIDNNPQDEPAPEPPANQPPADTGPKITLPGINRPVGIYEGIYWGSNFTWNEITKGGERIPISEAVTIRIVKLAKYMDEVRSVLGDRPIGVTSGYRDPETNRRVGGASRSRHLEGDAIDFYVSGENVVDTFNALKKYHSRGGLAVENGFVHLDLRPGGPVRWLYPGGPNVSLW